MTLSAWDIYSLVNTHLKTIGYITNDQVAVSYQTIARFVNEIPYYRSVLKINGRRAAKQQFSEVGGGVKAEFPFDRVEIDHSKLPFDVVDDIDFEIIGRPWITGAKDVATANLVGFCIDFYPPSYLSVMSCLRHMLLNKNYIKSKYPDIINDYNVFGKPRTIVCDNGPDFHTPAFVDFCFQAGIEDLYAPRKTPEWKGSIESFFGSMKTAFKMIPQKNSSKNADKEEVVPALPMSVFIALIHKWVIDVYSQKYHKGVKGIPSKLWHKGIELWPPPLPNSLEDIPILLGNVTFRKLHRTGIALENLNYNSSKLNSLLQKFNKDNDGFNVSFKIKFDPQDISTIYLFDHLIDQEWIEVPCVDQEYTRGLSLWEHKLIVRIAREEYGTPNTMALLEAQAYLIEKINHWYQITNGNRSGLAKFKKLGTVNPDFYKTSGTTQANQYDGTRSLLDTESSFVNDNANKNVISLNKTNSKKPTKKKNAISSRVDFNKIVNASEVDDSNCEVRFD